MKEKIILFMKQRIGHDVQFSDDDNIFELGLANSLFALQLVLFLENSFGIKVGNEDLDIANFSSINRLHEFASRKVKQIETERHPASVAR